MDIRNLANNGNVDRSGDRTERPEAKDKVVLIPHAPQVQDKVTISSHSRDTLATVEGLAERARKQGSERSHLVDAAKLKLAAGELSSPRVLADTAQRLLDSGFLAG